MKLIIVTLVVVYLLMAPCYFNTWWEFFKRDTSLSSEDRLLSTITLLVATVMWPIVVPIAYLELLREKINAPDVPRSVSSSSLRPLLISIFVGNLLTIFGLAANAYLVTYHNF